MFSRSFSLRNAIKSFRVGSSNKVRAYRLLTTRTATSLVQQATKPTNGSDSEDEYADVNWDNLGFKLMPTDYMYIMKSSEDNNFIGGKLNPFGNIELSPSAGVLNYGQGIFEGIKAQRNENGRILLFRPEQNAMRMKIGAERMCMLSPTVDQFVDAVKEIALANKRWVPPQGKGALYIRPLLIGSGSVLVVAPASEYTFLVYASPVGNYFKEGFAPLSLYIEDKFDRASRGGTGGVKAVSNYAPILKALTRAKSRGFSDVIFLDSVNRRYIEELSACNIFLVKVSQKGIDKQLIPVIV